MKPYRDLLKHGATYGIGQLLGRLASVLLLPLYTRCLAPADYGVIAVLDVFVGVLAIVIGSGMQTAVNRYHFEAETDEERSAVWWTGLVFVTISSSIVVLPLWSAGEGLAHLALGGDLENGPLFVVLALATMWVNTIGHLPDTYLRVRKWSGLQVGLSLGRLLLNVGLNVWFLVGLKWGVAGLLWGNLITGCVNTFVLLSIQMWHTRPFAFDRRLLGNLLRFGAPLVVTALLATVLHESDRYLLRLLAGREAVGVYSVAYKVGQSVAALVLTPFSAIWAVSMYEIAALPDGKQVFARVYEKYVRAIGLIMLSASLFARPLLSLVVADSYDAATDLVPIICLAYLFFSLEEHFQVPVMLSRRTGWLVPVVATSAVVNVVANLLLIPTFGAVGAAWASVLAFATHSFLGLALFRMIDRIPYRHARPFAVVLGMVGTYLAVRWFRVEGLLAETVVATVVCGAWTLALFGRDLLNLLPRSAGAPSPEDDLEPAAPLVATAYSESQS